MASKFERLAEDIGCVYSKVGEVSSKSGLVVNGADGKAVIDLSLDEMRRAWRG